MRFVTFEVSGQVRPGVVSDDFVVDLSVAGFSTILDLIQHSPVGYSQVEKLVSEAPANSKYPVANAKLLAPIPKPRKLICVGLNYLDHARETGAEVPKVPTIFNKFATAVI